MRAQVSREEGQGWLVEGASPGPAGAVDLPLAGLAVSLDAAQPTALCSAVLHDAGSAQGLDTVRRLLGEPVAKAVGAARAGDVPVEPSDALVALAEAELRLRHGRRLPLAHLPAAVAADACPGGAPLAIQRAWQALPAVAALGRRLAAEPDAVDALSPVQRRRLWAAVALLRQLLERDGWQGGGGEALQDLLDVVDVDAVVPDWADELTPVRVEGTPAVTQAFRVDQADLRLGPLRPLAFAGARCRLRTDGRLDVRLPLRFDSPSELPEMVVRVHKWNGEILGVAALTVTANPGALPVASARVDLGAAPDAADLHVDIALAGLPLLSAHHVQLRASSAAVRAGRSALAEDSAQAQRTQWQRAAGLWRRAGQEANAQAAERAAAAPHRNSDRWVAVLEAVLTAAAARQLHQAVAQGQAAGLGRLAADLSLAMGPLPVVAELHEALARILADSHDPEDRLDARDHAEEALHVRYALGDEPGAEVALTRLLRLQSAA